MRRVESKANSQAVAYIVARSGRANVTSDDLWEILDDGKYRTFGIIADRREFRDLLHGVSSLAEFGRRWQSRVEEVTAWVNGVVEATEQKSADSLITLRQIITPVGDGYCLTIRIKDFQLVSPNKPYIVSIDGTQVITNLTYKAFNDICKSRIFFA